jgi:transposase
MSISRTRIRGALKVFGLKIGRVTRCSFAPTVRELTADQPALAPAIHPLLKALAALRASFAELHREVLKVGRQDPVCQRLTSVPGVGAVTALAFRAAVDTPERFPRSKALGPHLGLAPRKYQSGSIDRNGGCRSARSRTSGWSSTRPPASS